MESYGQECQFPGCSVTDFLCTKCADCKHHFCEAHASHGAHRCTARRSENTVAVCPLCSCVVHVNAGASPDFAINRHIEGGCRPATGASTVTPAFGPAGYPRQQQQQQQAQPSRGFGGFGFGRTVAQSATAAPPAPKLFCNCGVAGCTQTAVQPVRCDHCARDFCLSHRTPEAHACAPFLQRKKAETEYRIAVTGGHRTGAPTTYFDGPVEYANKPSAAYTLRPGRVAEPTDLLVVVFFDASVAALPPSAAATARRGPVPKPFFLSVAPSNPVGRLLDTCCSLAAPQVRNSNADFAVPPSDTVHLYAAHRGQAVDAMGSAISTWCNDPRQLKPGEIAGVFVVLRGESPIPQALPRALLAAVAPRSPPPPSAIQPAQSCHQQHMQQQQQQHQYNSSYPAYHDYRQQQYQQYVQQQQQQQQQPPQQQPQGYYPGCYVC